MCAFILLVSQCTLFAGFLEFEIMLVEMFLKIFFRNHIYWYVFENLTFRNLPAI